MQDDDTKQKDALTKALLLRAAQVREERTALQRRGPVPAAPKTAPPATAARAASSQAQPTATTAPARPRQPVQVRDANGQADRVVMIIDGRHYVAPVAGRHPLKVAQALYRYITRVEKAP